MKKRLLFNTLIEYANHKNALIVTGMRQVGKTTLLRQVFDEIETAKLWFDFDNPLDMIYFEDKDYSNIYERLENLAGIQNQRLYVFIDEIQNFPEATKIVKYLIDHYKVKFFLTGSSNFYMKNLFPESLSGRKFLFHLHPLSFREFLFFQDKTAAPDNAFSTADLLNLTSDYPAYISYAAEYIEYLEWGAFPEVCLTPDIRTKEMILRNIFSSFFEKDLGLLRDLQDVRELRDLILLLIPRVGNLLDVSRLASELGVSRVKIYQYLEFLEGVFFLFTVPKFSHSIDRSVAGGKKVYFSDNGLLAVAGRVSEGQQFENSIANQLKHYGELSFYNKRGVSEIDFIIDKQLAFEVKVNGTQKDILRLHRLSAEIGLNEYRIISKKFVEHEKTLIAGRIG